MFFHDATVEHLDIRPRITMAALGELARTQRRLGIDLPASVREWYSYDCALSVLSEHSNGDPPIPVAEFALTQSMVGPLIPIRQENQGVCTWAILLDGSNDPPVFVGMDSAGTQWRLHAQNFSTYVYACVWDYRIVLKQPALGTASENDKSNQRSFSQGPGRLIRAAAEDVRLAWQRTVSVPRQQQRCADLVNGWSIGRLVRRRGRCECIGIGVEHRLGARRGWQVLLPLLGLRHGSAGQTQARRLSDHCSASGRRHPMAAPESEIPIFMASASTQPD